MEGRISATGLKSVEIDELTTNQIIINNEGLHYYHNYNIYYQQSQKDIIIYRKNWII